MLLGAAGRALGRRGWRFECARISTVKSFCISREQPEKDLDLVEFGCRASWSVVCAESPQLGGPEAAILFVGPQLSKFRV